MSAPTWETAKHLLGEYDGAATEIFVVGLTLSQMPVVMAVLADLPDLVVLTYEGIDLEPPEPFNATWRSRFEFMPRRSCLHGLRSATDTERHLQVYLSVDTEAAKLEVEFVFWNPATFPQSLEPEERERRLESLVSLADACRAGVSGGQCILAGEHNGPTDELLVKHRESVVVW